MILQNIFAYETAISDLLNPQLWLTDALAGRKTLAGEYIHANGALALSAYYAAIRAISEDVGKLPLVVYRRRNPRGKDRLYDHPAYEILHDRPNRRMNALTFRQTLTAWALGWGNGYAEIVTDRGVGIRELVPIHPARVTIEAPDTKSPVAYIVRTKGEAPIRYEADRILHIHGMGDDGISGYSVAQVGAESLGLSLAAQTFGAAFFGNGSALGGILKHPETLSEKALAHLRESWSQMYSGPSNAYKPAILEEGMSWERIGIPPDDAQFLETRQLQVEEIARWFRIPPHKIQHLLRATFSNIEEQNVEYVTDTLMPWLVRWEQELKRKVFLQEDDVFAEHTVNALLRGDQSARAAFYSQQFQIGALSQNDIRELENMNPIGPDGDTYYVPSSLTRSEDAAQGMVASGQGPVGGAPEEKEEDEDEEDEEEIPEGAPPPRVPPRNAIRESLGPVFTAEIAALLRKETKAAIRASQKCGGMPSQFSLWLEKWYPEHRADIVDELTPCVMAYAGLLGNGIPTSQLLHDFAANWEIMSKTALLEAFKENTIGNIADTWISTRQTALTGQLCDRIESHDRLSS